jgi:hypothetical protein
MGKFKNFYTTCNRAGARVYNFDNRNPRIIGQRQPQQQTLISSTAPTQPIPGLILCQQCVDFTEIDLHRSTAIVLSCMDFRLRDNLACNLTHMGYKNNYDEFILAGASLGYNGLLDYNWQPCADAHIELSRELHEITEIILVDHMRCGAYKAKYGSITAIEEYEHHCDNLKSAAQTIQQKYPSFTVKKFILSIDGGSIVDVDAYAGGFPFLES